MLRVLTDFLKDELCLMILCFGNELCLFINEGKIQTSSDSSSPPFNPINQSIIKIRRRIKTSEFKPFGELKSLRCLSESHSDEEIMNHKHVSAHHTNIMLFMFHENIFVLRDNLLHLIDFCNVSALSL